MKLAPKKAKDGKAPAKTKEDKKPVVEEGDKDEVAAIVNSVKRKARNLDADERTRLAKEIAPVLAELTANSLTA